MLRVLAISLIACAALLALLAGCARKTVATTAPASASATAPAGEPQVTIDNFAFTPQELTIASGTKVTWLNRDDVPHTATSSDSPPKFNSKALDTDDKFSFVFTTPGTYPYFCAVHPKMTGKIIVK